MPTGTTGFWRRAATTVMLTVLIALLVVSALPATPGAAAAAVPPRYVGLPAAVANPSSMAISAASASLQSGHGPAARTGACVVSGLQVTCAPPAAVPRPTNSSPVAPVAWTDLSAFAGSPPSGRYIAAMTYDGLDHYVLLFGGYGSSGLDSDTWTFVNNTWNQVSPANSPPGRYATAMAYDPVDKEVVMFAGTTSGATTFNDTWTYARGTWTNITGTTNQTPGARWREAMTWDAADGYVLMFGGTTVTASVLSDTWSFVKGNWTKLTVTGSPAGRYRASMVYDAADGYAVLFGGCTTSNCPDSATWTYHNLTWTQLTLTTHPGARVYFGLAYSPVYQHVLLFAGSSSTTCPAGALSDTWAFANGTWTQLTGVLRAPSARECFASTFDDADGYAIMFGGYWSNASIIDQTYVLGPSILGKLAVSPGTIDVGQGTQINATPFAYSNFVKYNYTQLPAGCTNQNVSVLSCTPSSTGLHPIAVTLTDSANVSVNETGSLTVNSDPAISSVTLTHTTVTRGARTQFDVSASGGTGSYTYHYTGLPPGCATSSVYNLTCTPSTAALGPYLVNVKITDQASFSVNTSVTLTVNPSPAFATVTARPAVLDIGQALSVWANLSAGTGTGPFSYEWVNLPAGCAAPTGSTLTCSPTGAASTFILVTATDSFGFQASGNVSVTVNSDPTIATAAVLPSPIDVGLPISIWVNGSGGTGALTYSYSGAPPGCTLSNHSLSTCTPSSSGNYTIIAKATDQAGWSVTTQLSLVVNPGYAATGLTASASNLDQGQNLTLSLAASGGTGPYSYAWTGVPAGCPSSSATPTVTCVPHAAGSFTITVTGTDAWRSTVTSGVQVVVNPLPTVTGFTASANPVTVGNEVDLTVATSGGSGSFTFAYANLPAGCSSANDSTIRCTPSATGSFNITVTVTDSRGVATTGFLLLTVNSASSGASLLGGGITLYLLIAVVVVVVLVALVLVMRRRRRPPAAYEEPAAATPAAGSDWQEPPAQ
ncbi:MAG TPA: kelch repeat-containing protein [Thermoplasmata archaeon]|nr:kelch repeat-containing protein [Thermoplasmata archaeon]